MQPRLKGMPNYRSQLRGIPANRASFDRRSLEKERSIFRPDEIVLQARESFQKVKTPPPPISRRSILEENRG